MPAPSEVLAGLHAVANDWRGLAVAWHLAAAALVLALWRGWRPCASWLGWLLALPLASVAALALATAGNPFNALVFAALAAGSIAAVARRREPVAVASPTAVAAGLAMAAFGWVYPHFLDAPPAVYLVAAPMGLVPCPTLAAVIGGGLALGGLGSRAWSRVVGGAGLFYGGVGVLVLGVRIDAVLLAGAAALLLLRPPAPAASRQ